MLPLLALSLSLATSTNAYIWPSPQLDALEAARFDQLGLGEFLATFINPCNSFLFSGAGSGRSNAADWMRTAYSDMATYDVESGTGGMDGSIRFAEEQQRPENAGTGFSDTFAVISSIGGLTRNIGFADLIALATVMAIENCGGPDIDFRGGRVDASEPNAQGVPQPQQDLSSHIYCGLRTARVHTDGDDCVGNRFAMPAWQNGFQHKVNSDLPGRRSSPLALLLLEGLVACGHTFGGVQHEVHPNIVKAYTDPTNTAGVAHFDSTFVTFDNNVATEYIAGTTQNPLVVGFNDTTNSDNRIFGSDGNVTMRSFAESPSTFAATCGSLFARMLDTVPSGVELTEVLTPLPVKPAFVEFSLSNNSLELAGQVRFWNQTQSEVGAVQMVWGDRLGGTGNAALKFFGTGTARAGQISSAWYGFNTSNNFNKMSGLDPIAGVERLRFVLNGDVVEDQGGVGFAVQDAYMFSDSSCVKSVDPPIGLTSGRLDVAVRTTPGPMNLTQLYVETMGKDASGRVTVVETEIPRPAQPIVVNSAYELWSLELNSTLGAFTIGAEIGGERFSTTMQRVVTVNSWPVCPGDSI